MGCRFACTCGGTCYNCGSYQKEEYFGHAEDLYDECYGNPRSEDEYWRQMMEEQPYPKQVAYMKIWNGRKVKLKEFVWHP